MAEIRTVTTLRRKRDEIVSAIKLYERQLDQAKADWAHILAAIRLFDGDGNSKDIPAYMDIHRIFKRGETWAISKQVLAAKGPMTTIELTHELMRVRKLETGDRVMVRALQMRLVNSLTKQELRGTLTRIGKRKGVVIWKLPPAKTLL